MYYTSSIGVRYITNFSLSRASSFRPRARGSPTSVNIRRQGPPFLIGGYRRGAKSERARALNARRDRLREIAAYVVVVVVLAAAAARIYVHLYERLAVYYAARARTGSFSAVQ